MEQTSQKQQPVEAVSYDLKGLMEIMQDLKAQRDALKRRVEHLEFVLAERFQTTQNRYKDLKEYFSTMRGMILKIFLEEVPAGRGLTYNEILTLFQKRYPRVPVVNLQRRCRELVTEDKKLWTSPDPETGKIRFFLKLIDDKTISKSLKNSEEK